MTDSTLIDPEMPKAYDPKKVEDKWYQFWLKNNYFRAGVDPEKKPFCIIMPPPNVTGGLHIGHAMFITPEDLMTRWHRMKGESALWLPGVDHAGIAAQVVVEQMLAKEGIDVEVVDLRTLIPLDKDAIYGSVRKTSKVIMLHEDNKTGGIGAEIAALLAEECFDCLDGPILRIAPPDTPVPFSTPLEEYFLPKTSDIVSAARKLAAY